MTGYAEVTHTTQRLQVQVMIRSVNSKQLDIIFHLPPALLKRQASWHKMLANHLCRGRVSLWVKYSPTEGMETQPLLDNNRLRLYYHAAHTAAAELEASSTDILRWALALPGVVRNQEEIPIEEGDIAQCEYLVQQALQQCVEARRAEGKHLAAQLKSGVVFLREHLLQIASWLPQRNELLRGRLAAHLPLHLTLPQGAAERYEEELLYYLEKMDVTEEQVRLASHLDYFEAVLHQGGAVGKKLLFITQEITRELNTLGAKAQDATLQHQIVDMKEVTEQLKEQLYNVV